MADDSNSLGDLSVNVTGDDSELQSVLDQAAASAEAAGQTIATTFSEAASATDLAGASLSIYQQALTALESDGESVQSALQLMSESAESLGQDVSAAAQAVLDQLQPAVQQTGDAAQASAGQLSDLASSAGDVSNSAHEAEGGLAAMAEQFVVLGEALVITEGLKEFVGEAINVYGATQQVVTSFELLGSSGEEAEQKISELSDMSLKLAVPFGDIEQAARRLTVAFQGVEGIEINDVLTAAANAAALTGKSFDQVTTALQRVEVTGAVTSRQLLQLGVTWQQLADQAGTSVAQVQALLKKGGQDATQDLQLVIDTLNTMAAGAAQAQAQTVLGQMTILKNQVELLFDAIGQDIAPTVAVVVGALSQAVQAARYLAVEFQALPEPVKDVAIALAAVAAAALPLTVALAATGLGLNALVSIVPAYNELMVQLGITSEADALAETEAAEATAAHGIAAAGAAPAIEALAVAEEASAVAATESGAQMSLFASNAVTAGGQMTLFSEDALAAAGGATYFGVEAGTATASITSLSAILPLAAVGIAGVMTGMRDAASGASQLYADIGTLRAGIATMSTNTDTLKQGIQQLGAQFGIASGVTLGVADAASTLNDEMNKLNVSLASGAWEGFSNALTANVGPTLHFVDGLVVLLEEHMGLLPGLTAQVAAGFAGMASSVPSLNLLTGGTQQLVTAQEKLANAVTAAKQSITELTALQAAGITVLGNGVLVADALAAANHNLQQKQDALNASMITTVTAAQEQSSALQDVAGKLSKDYTAWQDAQSVVDQLNQKLAEGVTELGGWNIAMELLPAAIKQATDAQTKFNTAIGQGKDSVTGFMAQATQLSTNLEETASSYSDLNKFAVQTPQVMLAAGVAFEKLQSSAKQLGIEVQQAGDGLQFSIADNSKLAADAVQPLIDRLNSLYGSTENYVSVLVNGNTVIAGYTQAQMDAARTSDDAAEAMGEEGHAVDDLLSKYAEAQAQVAGLNSGVRDLTQKSADFTAQQQKVNQAWADGQIVLQNYNGELVKETSAATDAVNGMSDLTSKLEAAWDATQSLGEVSNETANALLAEAKAADDAADALSNLETKKGAGGGSGSGSGQSGEEFGAYGLSFGQSPLTSGFTSYNQNIIDQSAQGLANLTGEIVTTMDGIFIPAAQQAAHELAGLQAEANSTGKTIQTYVNGALQTITPQINNNSTATASNTAATAANTAANTAATTATTTSLTATQQAFIGAAASGDNIVTSFASLPSTIQDYLDSVNGTLVAYDDTTGALRFTEQAANGLTETLDAATAANELASTATKTSSTSLSSALTGIANSSTATVSSMLGLVSSTNQASAALSSAATTVGSASGAVLGVVQGFLAPLASSIAGPSTTPGATFSYVSLGQYVNPNPGLVPASTGSPYNSSGAPNVVIQVSGNFAANDSSIQMLANRVAAATTNALRTNAGIKF